MVKGLRTPALEVGPAVLLLLIEAKDPKPHQGITAAVTIALLYATNHLLCHLLGWIPKTVLAWTVNCQLLP